KQAGSTKIVDTAIMSQAAFSAHFVDATTNASIYKQTTEAQQHAEQRASIVNGRYEYQGFRSQALGEVQNGIGGSVPRFSNITAASNQILNFYNPVDYALMGWRVIQAVKPSIGAGSQFNGLVGYLNLSVAPTPGVSWDTFLGWLQYSQYRYFRGRGYGLLPANLNISWSEGFSRQGRNSATVSINPHTSVSRLYESFAFGAASVAPPVGALSHTLMQGAFSDGLNLNQAFGANSVFNGHSTGHSAQFVHSNHDSRAFWTRVVEEIDE
ncbi:MAG TPA: hypothetical protein PLD59_06275, partial [Tepidisphaeraceae bacterium]|nr:hypothetical protein [Tepidisphaeraceae bacterium]